jgi:uncharacterized protein YqiB (DUF1249 family)
VTDSIVKPLGNLRDLSRFLDRYAFARLMAVYEENYHLCMDLLILTSGISDYWSLTADAVLPPIWVAVVNRAPYTLTLEMQFEEGGPEFVVSCRLYLDLKVCDVLFFSDRKQPETVLRKRERGMDVLWAKSLQFQKWLYYLKDQGYARQEGRIPEPRLTRVSP